MTEQAHEPVLLNPVLDGLEVRPGGRYIDGTLGAGGHTAGILARSAPDGRVLGLDRDLAALAVARQRLAPYGERVILVQSSYADMGTVAEIHHFRPVDGIVLDLGLSSMQLADANRGFSFQREGPLDMRFDLEATSTAADLVNTLPEAELAGVFYRYGEEPHSRRLARALIAARPVTTTGQLASIVVAALGHRPGHIHPATRIFQALRIAVNDELGALERVLPQMLTLLRPGGRLAVISFHSLEDRIVKDFIRQESRDCICPPEVLQCVCGHQASLRPVTKKPIVPDEVEIARNPRSRSAKMRVAERIVWPD